MKKKSLSHVPQKQYPNRECPQQQVTNLFRIDLDHIRHFRVLMHGSSVTPMVENSVPSTTYIIIFVCINIDGNLVCIFACSVSHASLANSFVVNFRTSLQGRSEKLVIRVSGLYSKVAHIYKPKSSYDDFFTNKYLLI